MSRPTTKHELLSAAFANYEKLQILIRGLSEAELIVPFDFSNDEKKKEAHWKRDRNLRDILIHLYEWHQLLLRWTAANLQGDVQPFLPQPYNWKSYGAMNIAFWQKHQNTSLAQAKQLLDESHHALMRLAESFSDEELFTKGVYAWVGGSTLGSYFISVTSAHYAWAMKKLKAHRNNCAIH